MNKLIQAKDIPELPVLRYLYEREGKWCFLSAGFAEDRDLFKSMPIGIPYKIALAKLRAMVKKGLISGCTCGCRGDFEITTLGKKVYLDSLIIKVCD